jgi:2-polyprenyl-3-methyl-5-hydroxy-6-metoxy-1,4-benzoquinol methylase
MRASVTAPTDSPERNIGTGYRRINLPLRRLLVSMTTYALRLSADELARYRMMAARARAEEGDLWECAGLVAGARVADVGCGPGALLVTLAEVVGPTGQVVGVDADSAAVAAARTALAEAQAAGPGIAGGEVRQGRADATGLPAGSVDTVVLRHVLAHNGGAEQRIVDHLATLVRPGGHVYLLDVDLTTTTGTAALPAAEELHARYVRWHELQGNDPRVGRRLPELARTAGLAVVESRRWTVGGALSPGMRGPAWAARDELVGAGLATTADIARWDAAFSALNRAEHRPEYSLDLFAVVCRRTA